MDSIRNNVNQVGSPVENRVSAWLTLYITEISEGLQLHIKNKFIKILKEICEDSFIIWRWRRPS